MSVKNRISKLEARKGTRKKTAIVHLPIDLKDEDEIRQAAKRLAANIAEPFDEWIIHDQDAKEPMLGWFGDLGDLFDYIADNSKRIGIDA